MTLIDWWMCLEVPCWRHGRHKQQSCKLRTGVFLDCPCTGLILTISMLLHSVLCNICACVRFQHQQAGQFTAWLCNNNSSSSACRLLVFFYCRGPCASCGIHCTFSSRNKLCVMMCRHWNYNFHRLKVLSVEVDGNTATVLATVEVTSVLTRI